MTAVLANRHLAAAAAISDVFKEHLGLGLDRDDEMGCAVGGCTLYSFRHLIAAAAADAADVFKERLGLVLEREDEIGCAVGGCNFLLRTITHEAFVFEAGQAQFVPCSSE